MAYHLSPQEVRVLGCLIEKELTTPDAYPLSLNALTTACNQKSSREPVVEYDEETVQTAVDTLRDKGFARLATAGDARVRKYRESLGPDRQLVPRELGLLSLLLLRGSQTPGELKSRSGRMYEFADLEEVERTLADLTERGFVLKLARQPGSREARWAHLFGEEPTAETVPTPAQAARSVIPDASVDHGRIAALEVELDGLRKEIEALREAFEEFRRQF